MATAEQYAEWLVQNQDKKGSPDFDTVASAYRSLRTAPAPKPTAPSTERTYGEAAKDIGAGVVGGIGSLVQLPGQLYGLATGDFSKTGALGAGEGISKYAEEMKSAGLKAREAERSRKVAESAKEGQFQAFGTALSETVKDPGLLLSFIAEQAPQLLIPFGAARGVGMAAKSLGAGEAAVGKAAVSGAVGAGATQQGADVGAGAYENIYKELVSKGATPAEAAEGSLRLARQAGAAAGTISLLAQRLPGARQLEEVLAGVPGKGIAGLGGRLKTAGSTAAGETLGEIPEEVGGKFVSNLAMQQVKPEQSLTEGLGEAAAMATIGGVGLGGAAGLARRPADVEAPKAPPSQFDPNNLSSDIVKQIESIVGIKPEQEQQPMLTSEEAARQRTNLQQKQIDANEQALIEKAAREGIPPQVPEVPTADTSKPSLAEQVPVATPRTFLEAKQAQIDQLRLDAGLPTGESSKTPGVQPEVAQVQDVPVPKIVDTRALDERAAQNRLLVMQNMLKNQGGDPDSLAIIPHPQVEGKFAIQSLDVPVKFTKNLPETAINRPETPKIIDPIEAYLEVAKRTNTPASMRLIRDYKAGIVTKEDIQAAVDAELKANQPLPINYKGNGEPWFVAPDKYRIKGDRGERYVPLFDESKIAEEPFRPPPPKTKNELPKNLGEYKLRMPRAYDNPTYREANKQSNFKMLADAMSTSPNPIYKRIGELSQKIASKVKLHKPGALQKKSWLGQYDPNDNSIKMRPSHAGDEWTNVHESVHALTVYAQRNPTPAQKPYVNQIDNLFEHVTKELKKKGYSKKNIYGLTDALEFTAEAMSNVEFQYMLMQIPYPGKKSSWTKFVELVADLLGITDTNALTEVMNLVDKLGQKAGGRNSTITPMEVMGANTNQPAFKRWFGDSKVVDENGKPLVVYHGTQGDFNSFKIDGPLRNFVRVVMTKTAGVVNEEMSTRKAKEKGAAFFTSDPNLASDYAGDVTGANVMPVYLSIKKPLIVDINKGTVTKPDGKIINASEWTSVTKSWIAFNEAALDWAKDSGADGFILKGVIDPAKAGSSLGPTDVYVAFNPTQIKSAIGNTGEFNPEKLDILGVEESPSKVEKVKQKASEFLQKNKPLTSENLPGLPPEFVTASNNVFKPQSRTIVEKITDMQDRFWQRLAQGIADQYRTIKDYSPVGYMQARLSKSVDGALEGILFNGHVFNDGGALNIKPNTKGLIESLKPLGNEVDRYQMWVALNRENRLPEEKRSRSDDMDYLVANRAKLAEGTINGKSRLDLYNSVLNDMNGINKSVLDVALDQGLIDQKSYDNFAGDMYYIPFYRQMEEDVKGGKTPSGLTRQNFSKALKGGSDRPFGDLMENTLRNWSHILSASMKNQAAVTTIKDAAKLGAVEPASEPGNDTVVVKVNGENQYFKILDPLLLESISSIGYLGPQSKFLDVSRNFKNMLQYGVTMSPAFKVNNLFRDSVQAMAVSDLSKNPWNNVAQGWANSDKNNPAHISALAGGAIFNFGTAYEGNQSKLIKRLIEKGVKESDILDTPSKIKDGLARLFEKYEELGNKSEAANRIALYNQLRERGLSHLQASFEARDLMDFSMQGSFSAFRYLTQVVPFMNARIQGLYKLGRDGIIPTSRVFYNSLTGKEIDLDDKKKAQAFSIITSAVCLASLALYAGFKDDEEFQKRSDWDRDNFWWIRLPGMEAALRIPKPFEIGALGTIAERTAEQIFDADSEGKQFTNALSRMVWDTFAMNFTPQVFKPIVDLYSNKDSFTGAPIETAGMEALSKAERKADTTSPLALALSPILNIALPEKAELSPVQVDYAIKGYFGWLGGTVATTSMYAVMPFKEGAYPDTQWMDKASLGFVKSLPSNMSQYTTAFYENNKQIQQAFANMRHYSEIGEMDKVQEIMEEKGDKIALQKMYTQTSKQMANIRKQISVVTNDKSMDGATKREEIDRMKELISMLAKQAEDTRKSMK